MEVGMCPKRTTWCQKTPLDAKAHHLVQSSSDGGKALLVAPKAHPMVGKVSQLMIKARLMLIKHFWC